MFPDIYMIKVRKNSKYFEKEKKKERQKREVSLIMKMCQIVTLMNQIGGQGMERHDISALNKMKKIERGCTCHSNLSKQRK